MDSKDANFLSMLSNPTINPPYSAEQSATAAAAATALQTRLFEMDQLSSAPVPASVPATTPVAQSPRVDHVRRQLLDAAADLVYITEGEYPFDFALLPWPREHTSSSLHDDDGALPTASEFEHFVLPAAKSEISFSEGRGEDIEASIGRTCRSVSLAEFFEPLVGGPDPFNQSQRFLQLQDTLVGLFGASGVEIYLAGERKVVVWILGRLRNWDVGPAGTTEAEAEEEEEERVLVGLKTYQIET